MSDMPIFLFLSPEGRKVMGFFVVLCLYLVLGWIWPIMKIRDKNVKTKSGWIMMLIIIGILPILIPIVAGMIEARRNSSGVNAAAGTSMNASPGPQPVVMPNQMRGALPANRPSGAY